MLARTILEPFDSTDHLFEPSWGGARTLAIIGPALEPGRGDVVFVAADGTPLALVPPELTGLGVRIDARSAVLDGELVVVDGAGRADPGELARRLSGEPGRPVAFLVFDLLHLDGRSLLNVPLERRRDQLRRSLRPGDEVLTIPAIPEEGRALFDAVAAQGLAGVLARHRSSPYLPGVRSRLWRFTPTGLAAPLDGVPDGAASAGSDGRDALTDAKPGPGSAPVLALIRRLPLGFEDPYDPTIDPGTEDEPA